jgi:hypothetical protein
MLSLQSLEDAYVQCGVYQCGKLTSRCPVTLDHLADATFILVILVYG